MSVFTHIDRRAARERGVTNPRGLIDALLGTDRSRMATLKDDPSRSAVYRAEHDGRAWVVKVYRRQSLVKMMLRVSPAWRELHHARIAAKVNSLRISTPIALATPRPLSRREQALILPYVAGEPMHHLLRTCADRALRLTLAAAVGRHVRALLDAGLVNRDAKLSNLIADAQCVEGGDVPVMIDPLGLRRRRSDRQVMRMWATLLRTTLREGPVTAREGLACLKAGMGDARLARRIIAENAALR